MDLFSKIFPLSIILASILGSGHCVAMCGAFQFILGKEKCSIYYYHVGRLLSYSVLGALAAQLGKSLFAQSLYRSASIASAFFLLFWFIWIGLRLWKKQPLHFSLATPLQKMAPHSFTKIASTFSTAPKIKALAIGISSVLLPCGWLYSYVLLAASTQNLSTGVSLMFFFWLGSLPAFSLLAYGKKILQEKLSSQILQQLSSGLVLAACVSLVLLKIIPLLESTGTDTKPVCALHQHLDK